MVTRTARATYYIAICVFLVFLAVLVVKMTFWPVCTGGSTCDGWTVAGLVAAVLGVSTAFLGILGALALAAWWTSLDKRVEDRVTQLFTAQIQAVQDSINQAKERVDELRSKVDAIEHTLPTQIQAVQDSINQLDRHTYDLRGKVDAIESTIPDLELKISVAQESATKAFEATLPPYHRSFEDYRKMKEISDAQHTPETGQ